MGATGTHSNLENRLLAAEPSFPNINVIWDLRRLLKSSLQRIKELEKTSSPDEESIQLEREMVRNVSEEIKRLEKEALCPEMS
jgi:hypothetical protein